MRRVTVFLARDLNALNLGNNWAASCARVATRAAPCRSAANSGACSSVRHELWPTRRPLAVWVSTAVNSPRQLGQKEVKAVKIAKVDLLGAMGRSATSVSWRVTKSSRSSESGSAQCRLSRKRTKGRSAAVAVRVAPQAMDLGKRVVSPRGLVFSFVCKSASHHLQTRCTLVATFVAEISGLIAGWYGRVKRLFAGVYPDFGELFRGDKSRG